MESIWQQYYEKALKQPHRPSVEEALKWISSVAPVAVDAGCGVGRDSAFLLKQGFTVHAFDNEPQAIALCRKRFKGDKCFAISENSFSDFPYPKADLVVANASLYFCPPEAFKEVWLTISTAIKTKGVFCGDFLGECDSWANELSVSVFSKEAVEDLFADFKVVAFKERNEAGTTAKGDDKHWHSFTVVAVKVTS